MFAAMKRHLAIVAACLVALSGCSTMSKIWPFHRKPKPAPPAVHEFNLVNADGSAATYPQYWQRNTLVVDLSDASGSGAVTARLPDESTWPVRVAVRVRPGSMQQLEILGEERNVLAVSNDGVKPIDFEIAPTVYTPKTAAIYISWGPMPAFAEAAPSAELGESATAAPASTLPPNTVPKLNIVWSCDDCARNDRIIPLLLQSYREEATRQGRTVSDAETADVFIVDFRQRDPNKRAWLGIMAGKDRLGVKIRFRGQILEASDYSANAWQGMNHLCESVGERTFKQIRKAF
jgi:hypothetical protein